ncbi:MAG: glutamate--cysteine ligase, partial [Gammaproteobacteria bacterium]
MYLPADRRLSRLVNSGQAALLKDNKTGLEKECLRVTRDGNIAQTPHPLALGSALTHPYITTDYSEALLEFITPPFTHQPDTLDFLRAIHQFVCGKLGDEILWATSMPCVVADEDSIPIAQYGSSHVGMMKTIYRRGLSYRYGRMMQVIAGVHFNFSLADAFWPLYQEQESDRQELEDFISGSYLGMIRNLQRVGWLILYLFGASPAICKSFLPDKATDMPEFDANTYYSPHGTSLRMGDIGYTNSRESALGIPACYDTLAHYVCCMTEDTETPH